MVAEARTWVDVEIAVREWAQDNVLGASRRVFFAANSNIATPQIVVQRVAGTDDSCLIQFDVWASKKEVAAAIAMELATAIDHLSRYTYAAKAVLLHGAVVESVRWLPDPEGNTPRYIVEATFTASSSEPETAASS